MKKILYKLCVYSFLLLSTIPASADQTEELLLAYNNQQHQLSPELQVEMVNSINQRLDKMISLLEVIASQRAKNMTLQRPRAQEDLDIEPTPPQEPKRHNPYDIFN